MSEKKRNFLKFIKSGTYTDKSGNRINTDRAASRVKKIDLDLETMKPASTKKMLTGGQAKIAAKAPPPNKIDAKDFAVLRAEKAKGRGMGLQDEKVQPGKVMKAKRGTFLERRLILGGIDPDKAKAISKSSQGTTAKSAKGKTFSGYQKVFDTGSDRSTPKAKRGVSTIVGVKPNSAIGRRKKKRVTYKSMDEMRQKTLGYKPNESTEAFKKRKANETFAKKAAKATGVRGKAALAVATAGMTAYGYLKGKMKKDKNKKTLKDFREQKKPGVPSEKTKTINSALNKLSKKMGGGMMKKPMGYNTGGPSAGFKSKQDRKKAEKNIKQARSKEGLRSFLSSGNKINQPMRKERYMEGRKARHTEFKKKLGKSALGVLGSLIPGAAAAKVAKKVLGRGDKKRDFQKGDYGDISVKKNMGGMMMQRPMGYKEGMGREMGDPREQRRPGPLRGRPGTRLGRAAGLGALGAAGISKGKEDSSVTLGKFMKAKVDSINKTVKAGGMGADRVVSKYRRPEKVRENIKSGKFKQIKDAAYYKSIGLTGKRGDAAVKDFFEPESVRLKNLSKNMKISSRMGGGMMQKPMGYSKGTMSKQEVAN